MKLTPAETRVLEELFQFRSFKEMAADLNLSVGTVKWHAKSIYRKAGIEGDTSGKLMLLLRKFGKFEISVRWIPRSS